MKLDNKDRLLLELLAHNARMTNRELARRVELSPSSCLARVKRLEAAGVIVGYRAIIARRGDGSRIEAWANIRLIDPPRETTDQFLKLVSATPEVVEAHRIAGDHDFTLRFCAGDFRAWAEFRKNVEALGCEAQSRFSILIEALK